VATLMGYPPVEKQQNGTQGAMQRRQPFRAFLSRKSERAKTRRRKRKNHYKSDFWRFLADFLVFFRAFNLSCSRGSFAKMLQFLVDLAA
jgi:hypothetical protein